MEVIPIAVGVFAGVATFLSPCMLPLIPAFLAHLAGVSVREIDRKSKRIRLNVFTHSLLFVVGFSIVFVILGSSLLLATQFLQGFQVWIARVGGAIIIAFGVYTLGFVPGITILDRTRRIESPFRRPTGYLTSTIIGATFGIGWTPCVGPILGSIFVLAGTAATLTQGATLLTAYSFGLGIPFLITGIFSADLSRILMKRAHALSILRMVSGGMLIVLGILVFTGNFNTIVRLIPLGGL